MRLADLQTIEDEQLGEAISLAFNSSAEPDPGRLAAIRDRLPLAPINTRLTNRLAQIVTIGVLTGSGLAAAWWGYEKLFSPEKTVLQDQPGIQQPFQPHLEQSPAGSGQQDDKTVKQGDDRRSPIIYQQEHL